MGNKEWIVTLEATGDGHVDDRQLEAFLDELLEHHGVVTGTPEASAVDGIGCYGATFNLAAEFHDRYRDELLELIAQRAGRYFRDAAGVAGLPAWPIVRAEIRTDDEFHRELARPDVPDVVGLAEVADLLKVARQRITKLQHRPGFPAPIARLRAGPVWLRAHIDAFAETWDRRPGRPVNEKKVDELVEALEESLGVSGRQSAAG
jgi:hypothetical protein